MNSTSPLSNVITIKRRFQRSVRVENDLNDKTSLSGYVALAENIKVVKNIFEAIESDTIAAFSITGPFGSGKSTLALLIASVANPNSVLHKEALKIIKPYYSSYEYTKLVNCLKKKQYINISLTASLYSLKEALKRALVESKEDDSKDVITLLNEKLEQKAIFIIADEFGKFISQAIKDDELLFIQELAELASRTHGKLVFISVLHQSFTSYVKNTSETIRKEWAKIQGRFQNFNIISSAISSLELLASSINCADTSLLSNLDYSQLIEASFTRNKKDHDKLNHIFSSLYPMHPIAAICMVALAKKPYGQNERSIFSFLISNEKYALGDFLKTANINEIYSVATLFDYVKVNLDFVISYSTDSHLWSLITQSLATVEAKFDANVVAVFKSVAILDLLGNVFGFVANKDVLISCLENLMSVSELDAALLTLKDAKIIIHKKFNNSYSLVDASDFDMERALSEELEKTTVNYDILNSKLNRNKIFIARRHYFKTGSLRWMDLSVTSFNKLEDVLHKKRNKNEIIGQFIIVVDSRLSLEDINKKFADLDSNVVIGVAKNSSNLEQSLMTLTALNSIKELESVKLDLIARREVNNRIKSVDAEIDAILESILFNTPLYSGKEIFELKNVREACSYASNLADSLFPNALNISNELINKNKLSATIVASRKRLLKALVANKDEGNLGFTGTPAEFCIYLSLVKNTKLHSFTDNVGHYATWDDDNLDKPYKILFTATKTFIADFKNDGCSLSDIYKLWSNSPYGIKFGPQPILLLLFILANKESIALYQEGYLITNYDNDFVDQFLAFPENIVIKWYKNTSNNDLIINHIIKALKKVNAKYSDEVSPLGVARDLVRLVLSQPPLTQNTRNMSANTVMIKNYIINAYDPVDLLFKKVPEVFPDIVTTHVSLENSLSEIMNFYSKTINELATILFRELKVTNHFENKLSDAQIDDLIKRVEIVKKVNANDKLTQFAVRLESVKITPKICIEGIISAICEKSPKDWNDGAINLTRQEIQKLSFNFRRAECFSTLDGVKEKSRYLVSLIFNTNENKDNLVVVDADRAEIQKQQDKIDDILKILKDMDKDTAWAVLSEVGVKLK